MKDIFTSEQILIGSCIRDTLSMYSIMDRIAVQDFENEDFRLIFLCIKVLLEQKKEITLARVASLYTERSARNGQDCLKIVTDCFDSAYAFDYEHHAELIQNHAKLCRLQEIGFKLANIKLDSDNAEKVISELKEKLALISFETKQTVCDTPTSMNNSQEGKTFEDIFKQRLEAAQRGEVTLPGIPYKIPRIDEMTGGVRPGSLVLIGGRTSSGKTQFVLNLVKNWLDMKVSVGMFSMEMPLFQIDARLVAIKSGLEVDRIERPEKTMESREVMAIYQSAQWYRDSKLCYDETAALTPSQLRARMYYMQKVHGIKICVVDFLTLMRSDKKTSNPHEKFTDIIHELQSIAKETGVAIVVLAQLNRENAKDGNRCPSLHQIRESGAIEESVDIAMLIHRPDAQDHLNNPGEVLVNLDKNRHTGKRSIVRMCFEAATGRYYESKNQKQSAQVRAIDEIPDDVFPNRKSY